MLQKAAYTFLFAFASASLAQASVCAKIHRMNQTFKTSTGLEIEIHTEPSQALRDPRLERARTLSLIDDFKILSDLIAKPLSPSQKQNIEAETRRLHSEKGEKESLRFWMKSVYDHRNELRPVSIPEVQPRWTVPISAHKATFEHTEKMWSELVRQTPPRTSSSLIPLPHPILIPGARFQEGYYWDTFFVFHSLLKTKRERLVRGQIENFLFMLQNYGLIPNGTRDYYLSRSQPPLISEMVRVYVEHEMKKGPLSPEMRQWLSSTVLPLLHKDYQNFWMNPKTRLDARTGLNRHFDAENTDRPERHSTDKEAEIAKTRRDVRAEAESGKDFTDAFEGEATQMAGVMLNSLLYRYEKNLAWLSQLTQQPELAPRFEQAAEKRRLAMNRYLWDAGTGVYRDYNLRTQQQSKVVTADIFAALSSGVANTEQAQKIAANLPRLERAGGLMSSEKDSGKQWDAPYGWAPHHFFAIDGLRKYKFNTEAERLARKWVQSVENVHMETGKIIEKIDAVRGGVPIETGDKYPTQDGFLWTNGVYVWALTDVLAVPVTAR